MTAARHVSMMERRLNYLMERNANAGPMVLAEIDAIRWALPVLRRVVSQESLRSHLGETCPACRTPVGFICSHLPART